MDLGLKGKKALVLGSSTGIGKAIAQSLIAEGADVALSARGEGRLREAAEQMGARAHFTCDLTQAGQARQCATRALEALGGLDILVTNAGGPPKGGFFDISEAQWHEAFQSLWMSVVETLHVALPGMKKNRYGRVIAVTSLAAKEPIPGLTTSNGLRAGLAGLGKSLATEVASFGITVNQLLPGYTDTDRLKELHLTEEKIRGLVPMGRLATPRELGDLATFLASPRAGYITGQCIAVDGGALKGH